MTPNSYHMLYDHHKLPGSIALVSILVIAAVSLIVVVAASDMSLTESYQAASNNSGMESYYMAEGCFEEGVNRLEADITFAAATLTYDDDKSCEIAVTGDDPVIVTVVVTNGDYEEHYTAQLDYTTSGEVNNFELLQWNETE